MAVAPSASVEKLETQDHALSESGTWAHQEINPKLI
jgi:hypothetical protein